MVHNFNNFLSSCAIVDDPFTHLYTESFLPECISKCLHDNWPEDVNTFDGRKRLPSVNRHNYDHDIALSDPRIHRSYKDIIESFLNISSYKSQLLSRFSTKIEKYYPGLLEYLDAHPSALVPSVEMGFNIVDHPTIIIPPHLDTTEKIFVGLLYLGEDDLGGDLDLWRWKIPGKRDFITANRVANESENIVLDKTIKYKTNTFIMMLNCLDSLHSVSLRQPGDPYRRFLFFKISLPFRLFPRVGSSSPYWPDTTPSS